MSAFTDWVKDAIKKRGWSQRELARRSGLSQTTITKTLGERIPTSPNVVMAIASVLDTSPETLLRIAGFLPPDFPSDDATIQEAIDLLRTMSENDREEVLRFIRFLMSNK